MSSILYRREWVTVMSSQTLTELINLYEVRAALEALLDKTNQQIQDREGQKDAPSGLLTMEQIAEFLDDRD